MSCLYLYFLSTLDILLIEKFLNDLIHMHFLKKCDYIAQATATCFSYIGVLAGSLSNILISYVELLAVAL